MSLLLISFMFACFNLLSMKPVWLGLWLAAVSVDPAPLNVVLVVLLLLQLALLIVAVALLLRRGANGAAAIDPRLAALLATDVPAALRTAEIARAAATQAAATGTGLLLQELAGGRATAATEAAATREAADRHALQLRGELLQSMTQLGERLTTELAQARIAAAAEAKGSREALAQQREALAQQREALDRQLDALTQRFAAFAADATLRHGEGREQLHTSLGSLQAAQADHHEKLRGTVEARLDKLNTDNARKLDEMRTTVDEKLHSTLQTRLTESFGQVTEQLTRVHSGLGEMTRLSAGMDDLSRIFTNVKSRGGFAEVQLGMLLAQMLAPAQYAANVQVKPNTGEMVEYCVKLPTPTGEALLPIDAKFPRETWERLESAYAAASPDIASAGRAFENAIRTEGRRICEKYIAPPATTSFAIMFLPTEGLYAEVMRRDGLQADLQANCRVTIAGPSTLSAILNSFQMGFHMLQMQQKGDEVWKVLAGARTQFGKFEDLMAKMDDQVVKVQKTIQEVGVRTRAINRTLRDVADEAVAGDAVAATSLSGKGLNGTVPMLAADAEADPAG